MINKANIILKIQNPLYFSGEIYQNKMSHINKIQYLAYANSCCKTCVNIAQV